MSFKRTENISDIYKAQIIAEDEERYALGGRDQFGQTATFAATERNIFDVQKTEL